MMQPSGEEIVLAQLWDALQERGSLAADTLLDKMAQMLDGYYGRLPPDMRSSCPVCHAAISDMCGTRYETLQTFHPGRGERLERPRVILDWASCPEPTSWFHARQKYLD